VWLFFHQISGSIWDRGILEPLPQFTVCLWSRQCWRITSSWPRLAGFHLNDIFIVLLLQYLQKWSNISNNKKSLYQVPRLLQFLKISLIFQLMHTLFTLLKSTKIYIKTLKKLHEYSAGKDMLKLLKPCNKGIKINCWESLYVHIYRQQNRLITERLANDINLLYKQAYLPRPSKHSMTRFHSVRNTRHIYRRHHNKVSLSKEHQKHIQKTPWQGFTK